MHRRAEQHDAAEHDDERSQVKARNGLADRARSRATQECRRGRSAGCRGCAGSSPGPIRAAVPSVYFEPMTIARRRCAMNSAPAQKSLGLRIDIMVALRRRDWHAA